jgi:hypothetical protein
MEGETGQVLDTYSSIDEANIALRQLVEEAKKKEQTLPEIIKEFGMKYIEMLKEKGIDLSFAVTEHNSDEEEDSENNPKIIFASYNPNGDKSNE